MRNLTKTQTSTSLISVILRFVKSLIRSLFGSSPSEDTSYTTTSEDDPPKSGRPKVAQVAVVVSTKGPMDDEDATKVSAISLMVDAIITSFPYTTKLQFTNNSYTLPGTPVLTPVPNLNQTQVSYSVNGTPLNTDKSATTTDVYLDNVLDADNTNVQFSYIPQS